jgi:conjugal transfer ATP-binding protein TraC
VFAAKQPKNLGEYMEQHIAAFPMFYELLPYESYDPQTQLFYNQDATGFVLLANPIVGSSLDDQQQIAEFFRQNAHLYEGVSLQFMLFASPHIGGYLDNWRDSRMEASKANPIFHKLAGKRSDLLKGKAFEDKNSYLVRDFRLLISYTVPGHKLTSIEQDHILMFRRELRAILEGMGVHSTILDATGLIREVGSILNIEEGEVYPYLGQWNEHNSISRSLTDTKRTYHIQEGQVFLNDGKTVCRSYIPKIEPKIWALGYMDRLIGDCLESTHTIGCPYLLHYGIYVNTSQSRLKAKAITKRESLEKSLQGNLSKFIPDLPEQYAESMEVAAELQAGGQVITSSLSYTIFSTPEKIQEHEQQLRKIWGKGGWSFQPARYDHLTVLLASLPMTWTLGHKKGLLFKKPFGMATDLLKLSKAKITVTNYSSGIRSTNC